AADEGIAEALRLAAGAARAPHRARVRGALLGLDQHALELLALELRPARRPEAERCRLAREAGVCTLAEEHDRRKAGAPGQLARPGEAAPARPFVGEQHGIVALREELGCECALRQRAVDGEARLRPPRGQARA